MNPGFITTASSLYKRVQPLARLYWKPRIALLCALMALLACNNAEPPMAPDAVPIEPGSMMPEPPVGRGSSGVFVRTGYAVSGRATLFIEGNAARLELSSDFSVGNAPGPVLYVNTTNNPNSGTPLRIGALRTRSGTQTYTFLVPSNARYTWIIIWCDPFNVPIAEAMIPPSP